MAWDAAKFSAAFVMPTLAMSLMMDLSLLDSDTALTWCPWTLFLKYSFHFLDYLFMKNFRGTPHCPKHERNRNGQLLKSGNPCWQRLVSILKDFEGMLDDFWKKKRTKSSDSGLLSVFCQKRLFSALFMMNNGIINNGTTQSQNQLYLVNWLSW